MNVHEYQAKEVLGEFGVAVPDGLDGVSLLSWLKGQRDESPRHASVGRRKAYATRPDVYFYRRWPAKWIGELDKLGHDFTLSEDPGEVRGKPADGPPAWLRAQIGAASNATATSPLSDPSALDPVVREALEALGYLEAPDEGNDPR